MSKIKCKNSPYSFELHNFRATRFSMSLPMRDNKKQLWCFAEVCVCVCSSSLLQGCVQSITVLICLQSVSAPLIRGTGWKSMDTARLQVAPQPCVLLVHTTGCDPEINGKQTTQTMSDVPIICQIIRSSPCVYVVWLLLSPSGVQWVTAILSITRDHDVNTFSCVSFFRSQCELKDKWLSLSVLTCAHKNQGLTY